MANLTPQEITTKQISRTKGALDQMRTGIQRTSVAPGTIAATKAQKMLEGVRIAIESGDWARRVAGVTLADWQRAMLDKGVGRVSAGLDAAQADMVDFHTQLQAFQNSIRSRMGNMPDVTLEDRIARQAFWTREMAKFKRQ